MMEEKSRVYTDHQKYIIQRNHFLPSQKYEFKKKHAETRVLTLLQKRALVRLLCLQPPKRWVFRTFCALFLNADKRRSLEEKESRHSGNNYHQHAFEEAYGIIERFENPMNSHQE